MGFEPPKRPQTQAPQVGTRQTGPPTLRTGPSPARQDIESGRGYGGRPVRAPTGMDLTTPGMGEQTAEWAVNRLMGAGPADPYIIGALEEGQQLGTPTNRAEEAYQAFTGLGGPGLDREAGLDPYYARQRDELTEAIDRSFGARGMFRSGAATEQLSDAYTGLAAEQANREADYALRRAGEERAWGLAGGQLGRGADISSAAAIGTDLNRLMGLGQLGLGYGGLDLSRTSAALGAGMAGQGAREGRLGDQFSRIFGTSMPMYQGVLGAGQQAAALDAALMGEALGWGTGTAARGAEASAAQRDQAASNIGQIFSFLGPGGGFGGMGF